FAEAGAPLRADQDPGSVFDRLFGADFKLPETKGGVATVSARDKARSKVLDAVQADAAKLRERLGQRDRERLEQHLDAVRAIQKRIAMPVAVTLADCKKPSLGPYDVGDASRLAEKTDVVSELVRMALACDLTRVFAYQWSSPASHVALPEVGITSTYH